MMLSLMDFNPKPLEPTNRRDFRGIPEVCKQEIAHTHPERMVPHRIIRLSKIAVANGRDWLISISDTERGATRDGV